MPATFLENQPLDSALKDCGEELEFVIKSLQQLSFLDSAEPYPTIVPAEETVRSNPLSSDSSTSTPLSAEWADLLVKEMTTAGSLEDARARASRALEAFEKEKTGTLTLKNMILKRAVVIQHERLSDKQREMEYLKQNLLQCQQKIRTLEVKNYALSMHLRQEGNGAVPECFHRPDVF